MSLARSVNEDEQRIIVSVIWICRRFMFEENSYALRTTLRRVRLKDIAP